MPDDNWYVQLHDFLHAQGHTMEHVEKIVEHVRRYDIQTQHDSLMESIGSGDFDLDAIIKEALDPRD